MKQMTGEEFVMLIRANPSWCKNLKEPLEITSYVELSYSNITHLSPLITFSGTDSQGKTISLLSCRNLKVATGTFHGYASFSHSGIEKIENLTVTITNQDAGSAGFFNCTNLKIATGTYNGFVDFGNSGVTIIKNLVIENASSLAKAMFRNCPITYVPVEYRSRAFMFDEDVVSNSIKKDTIRKEAINKIKEEANNIEI